MCTNRIVAVAVAAGGGGGSRTIEKRGQKAHFLVPRTENPKNMGFGCCSGIVPRDPKVPIFV